CVDFLFATMKALSNVKYTHSPLNLTPFSSSRRFFPVSNCCIRAFFCCWLLVRSFSVTEIASSQVDRILTILFCSDSGGILNGHLNQLSNLKIIFSMCTPMLEWKQVCWKYRDSDRNSI